MITEREHEIESFKPEEFWTLSINFIDQNNQKITASISQLDNNKIEKFSFRNKEEINKAISSINKKKFSITDISSKIVIVIPLDHSRPQLFNKPHRVD